MFGYWSTNPPIPPPYKKDRTEITDGLAKIRRTAVDITSIDSGVLDRVDIGGFMARINAITTDLVTCLAWTGCPRCTGEGFPDHTCECRGKGWLTYDEYELQSRRSDNGDQEDNKPQLDEVSG